MHGKESQQNITCLSNKMRDENQSAKKGDSFKLKAEMQRVKSKNESEKKILHCLLIITVYIMYT